MADLRDWADATTGQAQESTRVDSPERAPELNRFATGDEAITWYNGWLTTLEPPDPPLHPTFGWDPVVKWHDDDGRPIYWYVVGTGGEQSLVIESEGVVRDWGSEYYDHYAALHGQDAADALVEQGGLPEEPPPDLPPSTPEAEWIMANRGVG